MFAHCRSVHERNLYPLIVVACREVWCSRALGLDQQGMSKVYQLPLIMYTCKLTPPQTLPFFSLEHHEVFWKTQLAKQKEMTVVSWCHTYVWQHACEPSVVILTIQEICFCLFQISAWRIICQRMSGACVRFSANVNRERLRLWSQLKSCGNQKNILMYRPKSSRKEKWAALLITCILVLILLLMSKVKITSTSVSLQLAELVSSLVMTVFKTVSVWFVIVVFVLFCLFVRIFCLILGMDRTFRLCMTD